MLDRAGYQTQVGGIGKRQYGTTPHPVLLPMGEGTPEQSTERATASPLPPYPLADMASLSGKLAKPSLRGEGQGEGLRHMG
jgi:hypothetical protein